MTNMPNEYNWINLGNICFLDDICANLGVDHEECRDQDYLTNKLMDHINPIIQSNPQAMQLFYRNYIHIKNECLEIKNAEKELGQMQEFCQEFIKQEEQAEAAEKCAKEIENFAHKKFHEIEKMIYDQNWETGIFGGESVKLKAADANHNVVEKDAKVPKGISKINEILEQGRNRKLPYLEALNKIISKAKERRDYTKHTYFNKRYDSTSGIYEGLIKYEEEINNFISNIQNKDTSLLAGVSSGIGAENNDHNQVQQLLSM